MSLSKRGNTWWISFVTPSGERIRRSAGTAIKAHAQELHDRLKAESWRIDKLGDRPRRTWNDAAVRWLKEAIEMDKAHLRWLDKFLSGKQLESINRAMVDRLTDARLDEGVSNATVNRMLEVVRVILRRCANQWEWIDRAPQVRMLKEAKRRVRFLRREEAQSLLSELPEHLSEMVAFSLATGLRKANVTGMQWTQVDLERRMAWIHPDQAKARRAIPVPLNEEAVSIIRRQEGKSRTHVFSYMGKPITQVNTKAWYAALIRAGILDFRWHDLRHTWASWHVQNGTPIYILQQMGGWESPEMVQRYAHLSAEHLAPYADRLGNLRVPEFVYGTNTAQSVFGTIQNADKSLN